MKDGVFAALLLTLQQHRWKLRNSHLVPARTPICCATPNSTLGSPTHSETRRALNGARLLVAVIYPDTAGGKKKTTAYQKMLKAAGYEVDPARDEHQDDDGQILIPIRPRQT